MREIVFEECCEINKKGSFAGMNEESGVAPRRGADDRLEDGLGTSHERKSFAECFEGNIRCFVE